MEEQVICGPGVSVETQQNIPRTCLNFNHTNEPSTPKSKIKSMLTLEFVTVFTMGKEIIHLIIKEKDY